MKVKLKILVLFCICITQFLPVFAHENLLHIEKPLIYYGKWTEDDIKDFKKFDLIALQPDHYLGPHEYEAIQQIRESGTLVLLYISIGEDASTFNGQEPRTGDGRGPVYYDPSLDTIIYENRGIASYYLDHWNTEGFLSEKIENKYSDGLPDRHGDWGACYVDAGNPDWQELILKQAKKLEKMDIDGFFLDTPETPDPWQGYGWTAPGMYDLIKKIDQTFPTHLLLLNRGIFFFDPNNPYQYRWSPEAFIDLALFESYYLDSYYDPTTDPPQDYHVSKYYLSNKYYYSPKVHIALNSYEKHIPIINVDYADKPDTFPERCPDIFHNFIQDVVKTFGRLPQISDKHLSSIPRLFIEHPPIEDLQAPAWHNSSIGKKILFPEHHYYDVVGEKHDYSRLEKNGELDEMVKPRIGAGKLAPKKNALTVYWDIAVDQSPPTAYNIYYSDSCPFTLAEAQQLADVPFKRSPDYLKRGYQNTDDAYPYEYTITGLEPETQYYIIVRAEDSSNPKSIPDTGRIGPNGGIEDGNMQTATGCTLPAMQEPAAIEIDGKLQDWMNSYTIQALQPESNDFVKLQAADDSEYLYISLQQNNFFKFNTTKIYLDSDDASFTGHPDYHGADYMLSGGSLFEYSGYWKKMPDAQPKYTWKKGFFEAAIRKTDIQAAHDGLIHLSAKEETTASRLPESQNALSYQLQFPPADTAGPVFSQSPIKTEQISENSFNVTWKAAQDLNTPISYSIVLEGTKEALLNEKGKSYTERKKPQVFLQNLAFDKKYHLQIQAADAKGNTAYSQAFSFRTSRAGETPAWENSLKINEYSIGKRDFTIFFDHVSHGAYPASYSLQLINQEAEEKILLEGIAYKESAQPESEFSYTVHTVLKEKEYSVSLIAEDQYGNTISSPAIAIQPPEKMAEEREEIIYPLRKQSDNPLIFLEKSAITRSERIIGPFNDILGDGTNGDLQADIKEVTIAKDQETTFFNMKLPAPMSLNEYAYMVFIDAPKITNLGYPISNMQADFLLTEGEIWIYTGTEPGQWSWSQFQFSGDIYYGIFNNETCMEMGIPNTLLYRPDTNWEHITPEDQLQVVCSISDEVNETIDDIYPSYSSSLAFPSIGKRIIIDGDMSDWGSQNNDIFVGNDSENDGFNHRLQKVPNVLGGYADLKKISTAFDDTYFYIQLDLQERTNLDLIDYCIYFDLDLSRKTGYLMNNTLGVEYIILNGDLYHYAGDGNSWDWKLIEDRVFSCPGNVFSPSCIEIALAYDEMFADNSSIRLSAIISDCISPRWQNDLKDLYPDEQHAQCIIPVTPISSKHVKSENCSLSSFNNGYMEASNEDLYIKDNHAVTAYLQNAKVSQETIDGNFDDWAADPDVVFLGKDKIENRPAGIEAYDIESASYVFHDETLFVHTAVAGPIMELDSRAAYYIDSDDAEASGFNYRNHGFDYMMQGNGSLYRLADGSKLKPKFIGTVPLAISQDDHMSIEFAVPENLTGEFNDSFNLYIKFGSQVKKYSDFDEFGPFSLSKNNKPITTEQQASPPWSIPSIIFLLFVILLVYNLFASIQIKKGF